MALPAAIAIPTTTFHPISNSLRRYLTTPTQTASKKEIKYLEKGEGVFYGAMTAKPVITGFEKMSSPP